MGRKRGALSVIMDGFVLSINLGVYFTSQDNLSLIFAVAFAILFIVDWNAWLKK